MKKSFVFLAAFFLSIVGYAEQRSLQDAQSIAGGFASVHSNNSLAKSATTNAGVQLAYTSVKQGTPCFYVFNRNEKNGGFVIVSADDRAETILGYADSGYFNIDSISDNMAYWLGTYTDELAFLATLPESENISVAIPKTEQKATNDFPTAVAPLLGSTAWNQGSPYNLQCPLYDGINHSVTGCVATAMAQIMYYHKWPLIGTGASEAYVTRSYEISVPSVNFASTTYDWNNMTPTYNSSSTTAEQNAVATLMYHCGVSVSMDYAESSGAYSSDVPTALVNYFGYDNSIRKISRSYYEKDEWKNILKAELSASRPVYYSGRSNSGGHAFVCDGYDADGLFHFNWGWGGSDNGYFEISALTPGTSGIGAGSADGYNQGQAVVIGIQKSNSVQESPIYELVMDTVPVASAQSITRNGTFQVSVAGLWNIGTTSFSGKIGIALYQNDVFVQTVYYDNISDWRPYYDGWSNAEFDVSIPQSIANGNYKAYLVSQPTDDAQWSKIRSRVGIPDYVNLTVSSSAIAISPATDGYPSLSISNLASIGNLYQNKLGRFKVDVTNTGAEYTSILAIYLVSQTNPNVYQLGSLNPASIAKNETQTFTFLDSMYLAPGQYELYVMYDSLNYMESVEMLYSIGETPVMVTIMEEPTGTPAISVIGTLSFPDNNNVPQDNAALTATVRNTGGYFFDNVIAFIFPADGGSSLAYLGYQQTLLDTGDTVQLSFSGNINLEPNDYLLCLYYWYNDNWQQMSSAITFTLVEQTVSAIELVQNNEQLSIYPNPSSDVLYLKSEDKVIDIIVSDLTGKNVYTCKPNMQGELRIPIAQLAVGTYVVRVITPNGTRVSKFVKQ